MRDGRDTLLGAVIGVFFGSAVSMFVALFVGGCAHVLARADDETQYAAIFSTIAASVLTCIIVGAILGAYTGHYDGLGLSKTMILGTIVGVPPGFWQLFSAE